MSITKARINDKLAWIREKEAELKSVIDIIKDAPGSTRDQVSSSASSSSKKKGRGETVGIDESVSQFQGILEKMRRAIKEKEQEVAGLEKENLNLERY
uniref:Uncharacterized protein n=1 Tax=Gibberella zeae TaxID=5518 RepID=A0A4E9EM94_GIBZA